MENSNNISITQKYKCVEDFLNDYVNISKLKTYIVEIDNVTTVCTTYKMIGFTTDDTAFISMKLFGACRPKLQYSYDTVAWKMWDYSALVITKDSPLYIKGDNIRGLSTSQSDYCQFNISGKVRCSGFIGFLLSNNITDVIPSKYCFYHLFKDCKGLLTMPNINYHQLKAHCFDKMFAGCKLLSEAKDIIANEIPEGACLGMYEDCDTIKNGPNILATTIGDAGCAAMFYDCFSLSYMPDMHAVKLGENSCYTMFAGCTSLNKGPALPAKALNKSCYAFMFDRCENMTDIGLVSAQFVAAGSCIAMFQDCKKLQKIKLSFRGTVDPADVEHMFFGTQSDVELD